MTTQGEISLLHPTDLKGDPADGGPTLRGDSKNIDVSSSRLYKMTNLEIATDFGNSLASKKYISNPNIDYWKGNLDKKKSSGHANYISSHLRNLWSNCGWKIEDCFAVCDKMGIELFKDEGDQFSSFYWCVRDAQGRTSEVFSERDFEVV